MPLCFPCQTLTYNFGKKYGLYVIKNISSEISLKMCIQRHIFLWHITHVLLVELMAKVRHKKYEAATEMEGVLMSW